MVGHLCLQGFGVESDLTLGVVYTLEYKPVNA